jgi:hypothetical protein
MGNDKFSLGDLDTMDQWSASLIAIDQSTNSINLCERPERKENLWDIWQVNSHNI